MIENFLTGVFCGILFSEKCFCLSCVNERSKIKRSFLFRLSLFFKNHPVLLFVALSGCFLLLPNIHSAQAGLGDWLAGSIGEVFAKILFAIYQLFSWFVSLAATMFLWVIDVNVFSKLMNDGAIYQVWLVVRDFCNIFFILVLLFSAFATIFQLEKYEYKKTIPMLILMALLVNFSFPISRFVIDLANVPMYFFAQNTFGVSANDITSSVLSQSKIQDIMLPNSSDAGKSGTDYQIPQLLAAIICMFLFGISFLVLAILLLVRMIALAILVMFSPIGFVGMITPALHKFAHDWWDKLFKWAFYGPIAVMLVLVAIVVMQAAERARALKPMQNLVGGQVLSDHISSIAFFAIPIVLFWIAITQAEKYSNDMSGLGIKWGSNIGRKVGGWMRQGTWGATKWTAKAPFKGVDNLSGNTISGTALGIREAWRNRQSAWWGGSDIDKRKKQVQDSVSSALKRKGTSTQEVQKKVSEHEKEHTTETELRRLVDQNKDVAAAMVLAKQGKLTSEEFTKVRATLDASDPKSEQVINLLEGKVKERRLDLVMNYKMGTNEVKDEIAKKRVANPALSADDARDEVYKEVVRKEMAKINPSKWREQNLEEMFSLGKDASGSERQYSVIRDVHGNVTDIAEGGVIINTKESQELKARISGAQEAFNRHSSKNKDKIIDDISGDNFDAGRKTGIW
jgi:hypothetical protein